MSVKHPLESLGMYLTTLGSKIDIDSRCRIQSLKVLLF